MIPTERDLENESPAERHAYGPDEERLAFYASLPPEQLAILPHDWNYWGRPKQQEPVEGCPCGCNGRWLNWVLLSGRGFGKSRTGSEWVHKRAYSTYGRFNLVGATAADVRDIIVEGESGIMNTMKPWNKCRYIPTKRAIVWENGAKALTFSAEEPERLRGHQCEAAWADELASWTYMDETWRQLQLGLRIGVFPRTVVTTTPKPLPLIKRLAKDKRNHLTVGSTFENISNLSETFINEITQTFEGTRFGRQEIYAEILEDSDMALWSRDLLDELRVEPDVFWPDEKTRGTPEGSVPAMKRIVIGVDPSMSFGTETAAETGIVVCGLGRNDHAYVLEDASGKYRPEQWAAKVAALYHHWMADRVIAETNQGHALVKHTIAVEDPSVAVKDVHAQKNKITRAEPISTAYERKRVHHVGTFKALEDQMCTWEQGDPNSPDRMDAMVWAMTDLIGKKALISVGNIVENELASRNYWRNEDALR
jgi:phage terminase large subunit-like protein